MGRTNYYISNNKSGICIETVLTKKEINSCKICSNDARILWQVTWVLQDGFLSVFSMLLSGY